jgi:hypothetical protein
VICTGPVAEADCEGFLLVLAVVVNVHCFGYCGEAVEAEPLLDALTGRGGSLEQYIYCSSAGARLVAFAAAFSVIRLLTSCLMRDLHRLVVSGLICFSSSGGCPQLGAVMR